MRYVISLLILVLVVSCNKEPIETVVPDSLSNGFLVLNEGLFQQNNSSISWVDNASSSVTSDFFLSKNNRLLGDTGNDMQIYGAKIYIVVNGSSSIEVLEKSTGKSLKQINMFVGNTAKSPRSITFHGNKAFISCYDGFVDVLDTTSLSIVQRIQVGSNPEGLAVSNGKLFVANSGGLNFPNVDSTLSVIDLTTYQEIQKITVGKNPGSVIVDQEGDVYVIARGNYGSNPSRMVRVNAINLSVEEQFPFDALGISRMNDNFLITFYNYSTQSSAVRLFDPLSETLLNSNLINTSDIQTLYGVGYNPYNDKIYCLDAMNFTNTGYLRRYSSQGVYETSYHVGLNPSKILFYE
jgi:YVTN family beta-propeller protein